jgi:hypothetical protein
MAPQLFDLKTGIAPEEGVSKGEIRDFAVDIQCLSV